jgi:hypothetical protein
MENLKLYEMGRAVPEEAKKPINAGRLKGMTDINPMWRIKRLTEMFGACGVGWWYDITRKEIVCDETTKQKAAFVDILLYYIDPDSGKESHGIPGTGGASFVAQESKGAYMSDECFKMALTDAISVSAKALGIGADIYFDKDRTKYNTQEEAKVETFDEAVGFVLNFGKYEGETLGDVWKKDFGYIKWLNDNENTDSIVKKAIAIINEQSRKSRCTN